MPQMSTVAEITAAVRQLSPAELRRVRELIEELEADHFDAALVAGAESGVFDDMLAKAEADHRAGKTAPLHDILRDG